MKNIFSKKNLRRAGLTLLFVMLFLSVFFGVGRLVNPIGYNYLMTDIQARSGVSFAWAMAEEPSVMVGVCPLKDGDMLYYDNARNEWVTSEGCYPPSVVIEDESFVTLISKSLYRFDIMEAPNYDSHMSSMTLAPFCTAVVALGEDAQNGVKLHYGCETEIGANGFAAFEVHFVPAIAAFTY